MVNDHTVVYNNNACTCCDHDEADHRVSPAEPGRKDDSGKPRWFLLPWVELSEVVDVLTQGAKRYGANNWKVVPNAEERYKDALARHFAAIMRGEMRDPDSGKLHGAHIVCCALFLMWFENQKAKALMSHSDASPD